VRIAIIQQNLVVGDFEGNSRKLLDAIAAADDQGAELAVCSELALSGYPPKDLLDRPSFIEAGLRSLDRFAAAAAIPAVVGFIDRSAAGKLRNAAALVADGEVRSVHHKSLLPTYDVFDEARYFEPTDEIHLATLGAVKLGISICEDIWNDPEFWPRRRYPHDPIGALVELGADILINIAASPFELGKRGLRPRMLAAQARRHQRPLVAVNQVGGNDDLLFDGASLAFSADGSLAARAAEFATDVVVVDVVPRGQARGQLREIPGEDDEGTSEAALAGLVMGTADYAAKCGFTSAVVGLSGGIDSALTAAIAARALGPDQVLGVAMPSRYSSRHSLADAEMLAANLGIELKIVPIEPAHAAYADMLTPALGGPPVGLTEENLQARLRGVILMALSNELGHLLLTTGNKSEVAVGYCTLYGDMAGGLAVISDVPKTMVYELARAVNRLAAANVIPTSTLLKPPSAELRPDQRDQDSLPSYDILDEVVRLYVENQLGRHELLDRGFDDELVDRVIGLVRRSEYKRRQMPPGLKLTSKAFGPGRRMPIASRWLD
jgi:NAD+ synthetase